MKSTVSKRANVQVLWWLSIWLSCGAAIGSIDAAGVVLIKEYQDQKLELWKPFLFASLKKERFSITVSNGDGQERVFAAYQIGKVLEFPDTGGEVWANQPRLEAGLSELEIASKDFPSISATLTPLIVKTKERIRELSKSASASSVLNPVSTKSANRQAYDGKGNGVELTIQDKKLINCRVKSIQGGEISITHDAGIARIPVESLKEDDLNLLRSNDPDIFERMESAIREKQTEMGADGKVSQSAKSKQGVQENTPVVANTSQEPSSNRPVGDSVRAFRLELEEKRRLEEREKGVVVENVDRSADGGIEYFPSSYLNAKAVQRATLRSEGAPKPLEFGQILYTIPMGTREALKPEFFLFLVRDVHGAIILRHQPVEFDVKPNSYGSVYVDGAFAVPGDIALPFTVEMVNDVSMKKSIFRVKRFEE
jgi:hypothetical protein